MRILAVIFLSVISSAALAFDLTMGQGITCTTWLQDRQELKAWTENHDVSRPAVPTDSLIGSAYLIGFIEGYNVGCPAKKPLGSGVDMESVFERADNICKSKGGDFPLYLVAQSLIVDLDPQHSLVCGR